MFKQLDRKKQSTLCRQSRCSSIALFLPLEPPSTTLKIPPHLSPLDHPIETTVHTCNNIQRRQTCQSVPVANRSRDRRVLSKQFMLLGARRVRRALSARSLVADKTANSLAPVALSRKERPERARPENRRT